MLGRIRADEVVRSVQGAIDANATTEQLRYLTTIIPDEWVAASATGSPERCAQRVLDQFSAGATDVILHGATPDELAPVLDAYRAIRPASFATCSDPNPGRQLADSR